MQLIVLGMHRSGTSMVARLLNLMGAYFGPEGSSTGANPENPKGFWERKDVRALNDFVLHGTGCDWNRVLRFDPTLVPAAVREEFDRRASRLLLEIDAHRPWLLKEPRLCLLFPLWRVRLEAPVCIHVLRHPLEVASSLRQRNGIPISAGLELWERYVRAALGASAGLPAVTVFHHQLIQEPQAIAAALYRSLSELGVPCLRQLSAREVQAFIDQKLYRERLDRPDLRAAASLSQAALFDELTAGRSLDELPAEAPMRALVDYEASLPSPDPTRATVIDSADDERLRRLADQLKAKQDELMTARKATLEAEHRLRLLKDELEANRKELRASMSARTSLEAQHATLAAKLGEKENALSLAQQEAMAAGSQLLRAKQARVAAEQVRATCFADMAKLTRLLLQRDRKLETIYAEQAAAAVRVEAAEAELRKQLAQSERELLAMTAESAELRRQLTLITSSITWRLGAPLRRLKGLFRTRHVEQPASDADLLRNSEWFDADWYMHRYSDVAQNGSDPAEHYLAFGAAEGRNPSPMFSTRRYLENNPDVADSGMNPLVHYLKHGQFEGRKQ
jgi:hypothetical protein